MLDISALAQLKELKQQIQASVIRSQGVVKGTSKRFGFVVDDKDGQQYLLPQASMDLVLPGDRIEFVLESSQNDDDRPIARIEKLLSTELKNFIGQVKAKGDNLFVIADLPSFSRWLYIPHKYHENLSDGDLVAANIVQHPYKNKGFAQAAVDTLLGKPDDPYIEHRYAIAKAGITEKIWQTDELEAIRQTSERTYEQALTEKVDCREMVFFTIDGTSTQDLDDALAVAKTDFGWQLSVAIADVSTFITPGSPLDKIAAKKASSIYLPGQKVSMLPEVLSADLCSLRFDKDRLALICQMDIDTEGNIRDTRYIDAIIKSHGKLNYDDVAAFLDQQESANFSEAVQQSLIQLQALSKVRSQWRKQYAQAAEDYADYRLWLNERGKITHIERLTRSSAQYLVEECMLTCNEATAKFLSDNLDSALYLVHDGFKEGQMPGVNALIEEYLPEQKDLELQTLDGFLKLLKSIDPDAPLPIREVLRKKLNRSAWSSKSNPHFGLGLPAYTTFTSPIRKYSDLTVHRLIKSILNKTEAPTLDDKQIEQLNSAMQAIRYAQRDCELSLKCQYLEGFKEQVFNGKITSINHRTIGVHLEEFDVHGLIDVFKLKEKFKFKQSSLQLISDDCTYQLMQRVDVMIDSIDLTQRMVKLKLVEK